VAEWLAATAEPMRVVEAEANLAAAARRVPGFLRGLLELVRQTRPSPLVLLLREGETGVRRCGRLSSAALRQLMALAAEVAPHSGIPQKHALSCPLTFN
jgi:hypothetical protein